MARVEEPRLGGSGFFNIQVCPTGKNGAIFLSRILAAGHSLTWAGGAGALHSIPLCSRVGALFCVWTTTTTTVFRGTERSGLIEQNS